MNKSFDNGYQTVWDSTSLTLASTCPRKYFYRMVEGWTNPSLSRHLWFGQHYASSIEAYHKLCFAGATHDEALRSVVRTLLTDTFGYDTDDSAKNRETLLRSVVWYLDHYREDPLLPIALSDGRPAVELTFKIEIAPQLVYAGHLDRLANMNGKPMVVDQKTTGSTITSRYFDGFSPDNQFTGYIFAGNVAFGAPVSGAVIDAAQIAVGFTRFARGLTYRTKTQIDEWLADTITIIQQTWGWGEAQNYPMNRSACGNYGGCEFRKICSIAPNHREAFLQAEFVQKIWDPSQER